MSVAALFAAIAMLPAITGPIGGSETRSLAVPLCGGGMTSVPLDRVPAPLNGSTPCCAKGCHSSSSRKRFDRRQ